MHARTHYISVIPEKSQMGLFYKTFTYMQFNQTKHFIGHKGHLPKLLSMNRPKIETQNKFSVLISPSLNGLVWWRFQQTKRQLADTGKAKFMRNHP